MVALFRQNPLAIVLAGIAALFAVVIAVEAAFHIWTTAPAPVSKAPPPSEVKMLPPLAAVVPDQAYPESAARPLFTPTRRPAPAAPSVASTMVKGQFILTGVLALKDQRIALLKEKSSGKVHRVERGKEINGATLSTVDNERVVLSQGGDEEILTMQVQKGPAPGPTAAAAPSAGPFGGPRASPAQRRRLRERPPPALRARPHSPRNRFRAVFPRNPPSRRNPRRPPAGIRRNVRASGLSSTNPPQPRTPGPRP